MDILSFTKQIRTRTKAFGRYRFIADHSGVSYEWLAKFAVGKVHNPGVQRIHKLDKFFREYDDFQAKLKSNHDPVNTKNIEKREIDLEPID